MKKLYFSLMMALAMTSANAVDVTTFQKTLITPPDGLATTDYMLKKCVSFVPGDTTVSQDPVAVGFDGDDVYVQGFSSDFPDAWMKGTISGDKAVFTSGQYVGEDIMMGYEFFFCAADEEIIYDNGQMTDKSYTPVDSLVFYYDATTKSFSSTGHYVWYIHDPWSSETATFQYMSAYCNPELTPFEEKAGTPVDPEISYLMPFNTEYNFGFVSFKINTASTDGDMLLKDKIYYNIYLDDELYTFDADTYYLTEDMTDVPYSFTSNDITLMEQTHMITLYQSYNKVGVQTIYRDGDTEYRSNIVSMTAEDDAVDKISPDASVVSTSFYSLDGSKLNSMSHGIAVKVEKLSNGQTRINKVIR